MFAAVGVGSHAYVEKSEAPLGPYEHRVVSCLKGLDAAGEQPREGHVHRKGGQRDELDASLRRCRLWRGPRRLPNLHRGALEAPLRVARHPHAHARAQQSRTRSRATLELAFMEEDLSPTQWVARTPSHLDEPKIPCPQKT